MWGYPPTFAKQGGWFSCFQTPLTLNAVRLILLWYSNSQAHTSSEEGEFFSFPLFPTLNFNLGLEEKFVKGPQTP